MASAAKLKESVPSTDTTTIRVDIDSVTRGWFATLFKAFQASNAVLPNAVFEKHCDNRAGVKAYLHMMAKITTGTTLQGDD